MTEGDSQIIDLIANWKYLITPFICAIIGWLTNYIAVKMLFRPKKPVNCLFFTIQGIFPKRQKALAHNLGKTIEKNLISHEDLQKVIHDESFHKSFINIAETKIDDFINTKISSINPMIAAFLSDDLKTKIKNVLMEELEEMIPEFLAKASKELESRLVISELIKEKVEQFDSSRIEEILFSVMKSEFKFIEVIGGVLGFIIGLLQSLFFLFC